MTVEAGHPVGVEPVPDGVVRRDLLELRHRGVAVEAVPIEVAAAEPDGLGIGSGDVAGEVPVALHLGIRRPGEAVVAVAVVALPFGDPPAPEVPGGEGVALRVLHVVDHRPHGVAARAAADFLHALEDVVVRHGHRRRRHGQKGGEGEELEIGGLWHGRDAKADGTGARQVLGLDEEDPHAEQDPDDAQDHPERRHDGQKARQRERKHRQALATDTAVTLYSGWRDMGSTASETVRFTRNAAS